MISKSRHMEIPLVCSRTSPTSLSVALADEWNITLVGYLRRNSMNVYTHPERIVLNGNSPSQRPERKGLRNRAITEKRIP
jgi:hypothetical protein